MFKKPTPEEMLGMEIKKRVSLELKLKKQKSDLDYLSMMTGVSLDQNKAEVESDGTESEV